MPPDNSTVQETQFVFRRLTEALRLGGKDVDPRLWLAILIPVMMLAAVYVVGMYARDSRSVGRYWATFLGALRLAVYAILALVFLLPAWQTWDKTENRSKVLVLLDVSGSMGTKDVSPAETAAARDLTTRQDKVIRFLSDDGVRFLQRLQERNPVTVYRFGKQLDEDTQLFADGRTWASGDWNTWLKLSPRPAAPPEGLDPDELKKFNDRASQQAELVRSTNLAESVLAALNREANNMLQGIVVVSDGRSTSFSAQTADELAARARKAKVPVFTVGVGALVRPIRIRITDLQAPDQARPDDKFPVRVHLDGEGLAGQPVAVRLEVTKPNGDKATLEPNLKEGESAVFQPGDPPHAQVEFEIDKPEVEGEWKLVGKAPVDKRELTDDKEHISEPATVNVVKKPLRVLLFAGGSSKDYQFARTLFVREMDKKRAEVSIFLQLARPEIVQDVPAEQLLTHFPGTLRDEEEGDTPETRYDNLARYDVVIAFDPDWTQLTPEQLSLLEKWVGTHAGGLILVPGPINTFQLVRGVIDSEKIKPIVDLFPVFLENSQIQGLGLERPTSDPWRLNFTGATSNMEFLKLDEEGKDPLGGWEEFFTGHSRGEGVKDAPLRRGFYNYYPVRAPKPNATVVATFADPRARLSDGKEQPYLVTMPYGNGKVVYIGSGEVWRLRQYPKQGEVFHERFWTKLARYAGSGNLIGQTRRGRLNMGSTFTAQNFIRVEAQLFDKDMQPLGKTAKPKVEVKPPQGVALQPNTFELAPKPGQGDEVTGWFAGRFLVMTPGNYEIRLQIPGSPEVLTKKVTVQEADPEMENTMPDFGQLRQLASEAAAVLARIPSEENRARVRRVLELTNKVPVKDTVEDKEALRLYCDLNSAGVIPDCMVTDRKTQRNRGPVRDIWDAGFTIQESDPPLTVSIVLLVVVGLLSLEWLTRKLLKLA